jgi:predicted secreted hydrolase
MSAFQERTSMNGRRSAVLVAPVLLALACCPAEIYELTTPDPTVHLPADEAPHCYGMEWWYYTGRLTTQDGRSYGAEAVIFRVPKLQYLFGSAGWFAHLALLDENSQAFTYDQGRWLEPGAGASTTDNGVQLDTPLIQMTLNDGHDHLQAAARDGHFSLNLDLLDERGPVLHNGGYIVYGPSTRSFYYSRPRMLAQGTLTVDGQPQQVTGQLWFDRQWGRNVITPTTAWDWFSLRLDDGGSVMLFNFRDLPTPVALGTYVPPTGDPVTLAAGDFVITPTASWTSPHTGRTYPVAWEIQIPSQGIVATVTAVADDQEFDARSTTLNVYWEGLCDVTGTHDGQTLGGDAYVELVNYP